jgi:hypothetical protein
VLDIYSLIRDAGLDNKCEGFGYSLGERIRHHDYCIRLGENPAIVPLESLPPRP